MIRAVENRDELISCPVCDVYLSSGEGFMCPKCRRGPLCRRHRIRGRRECASCVFEMQTRELNEMKAQETSLSSFLRLLQFLFLVFAVLFVALRTGIPEVLDFLQYSIITDSFGYLGGLSVVGYLLFYTMRYNQRKKIEELESELKKTEFRRMVK
jgi:uncharacterized protein (DUF983 family)